ncbi:MAG: hypothetical protein QUS14_09425 [Pyrinomonadaceae bacterium]|nr:hypothetical protein [Pyrinomonadaceae bacterium]
MKIRIRGNSIRLRLGQTEAAMLARGETVEEFTDLGTGQRFVYAVTVKDAAAITASFADGRLEVSIPAVRAAEWAEGGDVSLEASQRTSDGGKLQITIEKDFACLKPRGPEEDRDSFPHPEKAVC